MHERALAALQRMPTVAAKDHPAAVRSIAVFGKAPTGIALPLNRKTTKQEIRPIPLVNLEPRQELIPKGGLEKYIVRPRRDPADVAHVVMRDGSHRWLIQEGHTRLGAAYLRGDEDMAVRVWEFVQNDSGGFDPVVRGRHRIGQRFRDKLVALAEGFDLADWDESLHPRDEQGRFAPSSVVANKIKAVLGEGGSAYIENHPTAVDAGKTMLSVLAEMKEKGYELPASVAVTRQYGHPSGVTHIPKATPENLLRGMGSDLMVTVPMIPGDVDLDAAVAAGLGATTTARTIRDVVIHEMGHVAHGSMVGRPSADFGDPDVIKAATSVSKYAASSPQEFLAESFSRLYRGEKLTPEAMALYKKLEGPAIK